MACCRLWGCRAQSQLVLRSRRCSRPARGRAPTKPSRARRWCGARRPVQPWSIDRRRPRCTSSTRSPTRISVRAPTTRSTTAARISSSRSPSSTTRRSARCRGFRRGSPTRTSPAQPWSIRTWCLPTSMPSTCSRPRHASPRSDWTRITADDARVPISDAQAALGVDWDLTTVPPGVYTIWGYTWDPLVNLWAPRPGFVKLIASASEADAVGPAIALVENDEEVTIGEPHAVVGCADVPAGSTVTLEWGVVEGPVEPQWHALVVDEPISSGALTLDVTLPDDAMGEEPGLLGPVASDRHGPEWTSSRRAFAPTRLSCGPAELGGRRRRRWRVQHERRADAGCRVARAPAARRIASYCQTPVTCDSPKPVMSLYVYGMFEPGERVHLPGRRIDAIRSLLVDRHAPDVAVEVDAHAVDVVRARRGSARPRACRCRPRPSDRSRARSDAGAVGHAAAAAARPGPSATSRLG